VTCVVEGRHDPCIIPRIVPVIEAMTAFVLADMLLLSRGDRLEQKNEFL
jgi:chorismate synthase